MNYIESVSKILLDIKPTKDMSGITDIVEGGYLDSFELMALISQLSEDFGIEIEIDDITPENFNSIEAISAMVERLVQKKETKEN